MDALLSDVIIGSSSPPLAYPPHYFNICTSHQVCREFNLFDGAVISNNPLTKSSSITEGIFVGGSSDDGIITILSIDGGGVKGVIPATILVELESMLQDLDGDDVRIVDYFDMIGGSSTGAIIGGFLTTPNGNGRPLYGVNDIINFYYNNISDLFVEDPKCRREEAGYEAKGYKWGITDYYNLSHVFDEDYTSLNSLISDTANDRMVELYSHLLLDKSNFLRIQVDTLSSSEANFANGTKANLMHLGETAQELLNQNLTSFDPSTCRFVPVPNGGTTREALLK
ncbi:hypothetical protein NE237_006870 [Protea cynaroides]|uniref:Patatin n=1 Tax=Protea cynaroides TaxID=273540 RepID=A0A9Q0KNW8_9MAGN|nr:hypothetical protein NE237_006870 [Protea cynaroides]